MLRMRTTSFRFPARQAIVDVCALVALSLILGCISPATAASQSRSSRPARLKVVVADQTGAVIVGAHVSVTDPSSAERAGDTNSRGEVSFELTPGRYVIKAAAAGFETVEVPGVRLRPGDNRREIRLQIARLTEEVLVRRDPREANSDPRSDAFSSTLTPDEIAGLPDDPEELERVLKQMAGPGSTIRVNGFRGGKLPPKAQIQHIRFRRNAFAADNHDPGNVSVEITTRPGLNGWRGASLFGFRDESLSARNAFAPRLGPEQQRRYGFSLDGPLWKNHTSLALSVEGLSAFESKTIVAALPERSVSDLVRRPTDRIDFSARIEHALTRAHILRGELQRNTLDNHNLGVGDYDLPERGFSRAEDETLFRLSDAGSFGKSLFNEFRFQWRRRRTEQEAVTESPAILVLNAFQSGGVQVAGGRTIRDFELANNLDFTTGRHSLRSGFLLEGGRYRSDELRNSGGTFIFSGLAAFQQGRPTTFTRRDGDPTVTYSHYQAGLYLQDDIRLRKDLTVSLGLRQEMQTHLNNAFNLGPRASFTWSPFKGGRTTIRGGTGIFYDWFEPESFEQTLRVDGNRQRELVVQNPGFPDPFVGANPIVLPPGRIQADRELRQPLIHETAVGVEQQLAGGAKLNAAYIRREGSRQFRGRNINAPLPELGRSDPSAGNITAVESTARSSFQAFELELQSDDPSTPSVPRGELLSLDERQRGRQSFQPPSRQLQPRGRAGPGC